MSPCRILTVGTLLMLGCRAAPEPLTMSQEPAPSALAATRAGGLRVTSFPAEDPGPPFYSRVTRLLNQVFHDDGHVAIPFYRDPSCVPGDFDLLQAFHLPGEDGPGAFGCPLTVTGRFLIEPDAPVGTFPVEVITTGEPPIWFVPWDEFQSATADGDLTMAELRALSTLRGVASQFHEKLSPRMENHHVVITSRGRLDDGRSFQFNVNHRGDRTQSITIRFR